MSCETCPRAGSPCAGEQIPRICQLVDPSHPDYDPTYLAATDPAPLGPTAPAPEPAPPLLPLAIALEATRRIRECPESRTPDCACDAATWCDRKGGLSTLRECAGCLGLTGPAGPA